MSAPASELLLTSPNVCPRCGQKLPSARGRCCAICQKPIKRHDKYVFVGSSIQHRDCDNPREYPKDGQP